MSSPQFSLRFVLNVHEDQDIRVAGLVRRCARLPIRILFITASLRFLCLPLAFAIHSYPSSGWTLELNNSFAAETVGCSWRESRRASFCRRHNLYLFSDGLSYLRPLDCHDVMWWGLDSKHGSRGALDWDLYRRARGSRSSSLCPSSTSHHRRRRIPVSPYPRYRPQFRTLVSCPSTTSRRRLICDCSTSD